MRTTTHQRTTERRIYKCYPSTTISTYFIAQINNTELTINLGAIHWLMHIIIDLYCIDLNNFDSLNCGSGLLSMSARPKKSKQMLPTSEKVATPKKADHSRATSSTGTSASESTEYRSPSPLNISRVDEKEELAHLNDRLASYIDYVRKLERDKECLTRRISTISEERLSQIDEARKTYEKEITSLRRLVDDLAKEKAAKDVELKKHIDDMNEAKAKLCKRDAEVRCLQLKFDALERDVAVYKQNHERYQRLCPEYDEMEKKLEATRKGLEAETVLRTDLENKVASLREELDFKDRLFQEERSKLVMRTLTVEEEVEDRKAAEFESRLADELQAYRQQTNDELQQYRIQMETTFQTKLEQLQQANVEANKDSGRLNDELLVMRRRCDDLCHELAKKTREVDLLQNRVHDLENLLNKAHDDYQAQLAAERDEIKRLKTELEQRFAEFTDLMNTKVALDQEILMYRKMLEGEESRLNLTSPKRASPFSGAYMGTKRRRLDSGDEVEDDSGLYGSQFAFRVSTSAIGDIEFTADQDGSGRWIKLINVAKDDINIGNWVLKHQADGEEVTYKFGRTFNMKPGSTCTIWGSDSDATHNPPETVVMKNQTFHSGANITITLISEDEKEQASCLIVRECTRPKISSRRFRAGATKSEEKCSLINMSVGVELCLSLAASYMLSVLCVC
uniref:Lamin n=1 Tax=Echinococcus granulosus TaxID=6210 RepID=A0A068WHD2_ECHGR|nr:lamin [Echinococcus granulosus]